jgi:hypothetical protein
MVEGTKKVNVSRLLRRVEALEQALLALTGQVNLEQTEYIGKFLIEAQRELPDDVFMVFS